MIVTLLTDFGTRDIFAGVMEGVIKTIAPSAEVIHLTHHVPRQDIAAGAFALKTASRYFPSGTIHLAVVDPGVGGARRPIAARIGDYVYVCPDNGLLSYVLSENTVHSAVTLDNSRYHLSSISRTFHGRDIFAPAAAHLANGVLLEILGTPQETLRTFPLSRPDVSPTVLTCHVLYCDVFGNVFTDLTEDLYETWAAFETAIEAGGLPISGPLSSYSDAPPGQALALFGSSGHLEIAVRNGSAQKQLGLKIGDAVLLRTGKQR